ncbi:hypothetical protein K474DRAFT_1726767 [Panus rudis PR-1116 ss-1]|nr:hypothetical protein K474DRAFT_1726767 [Panus rudis PR-1116 ss-1]
MGNSFSSLASVYASSDSNTSDSSTSTNPPPYTLPGLSGPPEQPPATSTSYIQATTRLRVGTPALGIGQGTALFRPQLVLGMDPRMNRNVEYNEFMEHFVKAGLAQATDEDEIKALLKECKLFNSVIDFVWRCDPEGIAPDLHSQAKRATKLATPKPVSPLTPASTGSPPGTIDLDKPQHGSPSSTSISQSQPSLQSGPTSSFDSTPGDEPQASTGSNPNPLPSVEENLIARCLWDFIHMFFEVKFSVDPYSFTRGSTDRFSESKDAEYGRGQIADYSGECLECQHCLFLFSLYIYRDQFSIQLWDRNGMVMSSRENYKSNPINLIRFLYYFVKMLDEQVGYDPPITIEELDSSSVRAMKVKIEDASFKAYLAHICIQVKKAMEAVFASNDSNTSDPQTPIYKVSIPNEHGIDSASSPHCPKLSSSGPEPYGHGTKGFVAFDTDKEDFIFLKDAWRETSSNPEAAVYKTQDFLGDSYKIPMLHHRLVLEEIGVRATPSYHKGQLRVSSKEPNKTKTKRTKGKTTLMRLITPRLGGNPKRTRLRFPGGLLGVYIHTGNPKPYRLCYQGKRTQASCMGKMSHPQQVADTMSNPHQPCGGHAESMDCMQKKRSITIGLPLAKFQTFEQLCTFVYDALLAHQGAWEDAHILHHDISKNNIIFFPKLHADGTIIMTALLIDWDLCKYREQLHTISDGNRSGTWAFLSAPRFQFPGKPWEVADDLESFVHLINWFTLRFHPHDLKREELVSYLRGPYQTCTYHPEIKAYSGCLDKIRDIESADPWFKLLPSPQGYPTNLASLIKALMKLAQEHWQIINQDAYAPYRVPNVKSNPKPSKKDEEDALIDQDVVRWTASWQTTRRVNKSKPSTGGGQGADAGSSKKCGTTSSVRRGSSRGGSRLGSHERNASSRTGSKQKAMEVTLTEGNVEPEFEQGSSTDVRGIKEGAFIEIGWTNSGRLGQLDDGGWNFG